MTVQIGPRLLVLSDIHASDHSFPEPLLPTAPPTPPGNSSWIDFADPTHSLVDPITTFIRLAVDESLRADYLIVPGDICDKANGRALEIAWGKLHEIAELVGAREIITTVGNHDLDSRYRRHTYDPTNALRCLQPQFPARDTGENNAFWANGVAVLPRDNARFVILNSCLFHGNTIAELDYGRVAQRTLDALRDHLGAAAGYMFNVVLCHHPPIPFPGSPEGRDDHMRDGQNLIQALDDDSNTWLVIHGHRHQARIRYGVGDFGSPVLFAAGSMGACIRPEHGLRVRNQVHLISCFGDVSAEVPVGGKVKSWDYSIDFGWEPAQPLDGLPAGCGFGHRGQPGSLASRISTLVQAHGGPVPWSMAESTLPELGFLTPVAYGALVDDLVSRHSLRIVPSSHQPLEIARIP